MNICTQCKHDNESDTECCSACGSQLGVSHAANTDMPKKMYSLAQGLVGIILPLVAMVGLLAVGDFLTGIDGTDKSIAILANVPAAIALVLICILLGFRLAFHKSYPYIICSLLCCTIISIIFLHSADSNGRPDQKLQLKLITYNHTTSGMIPDLYTHSSLLRVKSILLSNKTVIVDTMLPVSLNMFGEIGNDGNDEIRLSIASIDYASGYITDCINANALPTPEGCGQILGILNASNPGDIANKFLFAIQQQKESSLIESPFFTDYYYDIISLLPGLITINAKVIATKQYDYTMQYVKKHHANHICVVPLQNVIDVARIVGESNSISRGYAPADVVVLYESAFRHLRQCLSVN